MLKKITILSFLLLSFSIYSNAQLMSSRNILDNLLPYWEFLEELRNDLSKSNNTKYTASLEQAYTFIQLELKDEEGQRFLQIKYQIPSATKAFLYSFYCDNKNIAIELESRAKKYLTNFESNTPAKSKFKLSEEQIHYLEIADRIAAVGNDISTYPSLYNSLILTTDFVKLIQDNHLNSKSLDHKDSYLLRDLCFIIPLKEKILKEKSEISIGHYFIENMEILFQDGSAQSQRETGDQISLQIKEEIENYK